MSEIELVSVNVLETTSVEPPSAPEIMLNGMQKYGEMVKVECVTTDTDVLMKLVKNGVTVKQAANSVTLE